MDEELSCMGTIGEIYRALGSEGVFVRSQVHPRDRALMRLGAVLGCRHTGTLYRQALREEVGRALTVDEAEELLIHLACYVGFAVAIEAAQELLQLVRTSTHADFALRSTDHTAARTLDERFDLGFEHYSRFDTDRAQRLRQQFSELSSDYYKHAMGLFGCTYPRPGLDTRARQIVTLAAISSAATAPEQLAFHTGVSLRCGVERELLAEVLYHVQLFAGLPAANNAAKAMLSALSSSTARRQ